MVERYTLVRDGRQGWGLAKRPNGVYVHHSDYEALRAELEQVRRDRDANHNLAIANGERAKDEHRRAEAAERLAEARVVVKPLEWSEYETEGWADRADAEAGSFGVFYNIDIQRDGYRVVFDREAVGAIGTFETADEAKAATQADYERRILSALAEPAGEVEPEPVAYPKIMYVCEHCHEHNPEMCGHDRTDIYVTPDGRWLCDGCLDEEGVPHRDCVSPPTLYTSPVATPPASAIRGALPATGRYVDRLIRIFRDRPDDDTSAVVLQDYARAALAGSAE
ncbi:hypothetical protein [Aquamicrobium terrae]|uniref:Uncharacterized protein n=1 Tax=Aquamicrobium terrae TaxID=1324945 RepID=A0ABV2MW34_9HYPH